MKKSTAILNLLIVLISSEAYSEHINNPFFANLADNSWTRVPTINNPKREEHAGVAIDNESGKLYIYGSNTHGATQQNNSVYTLDLATLVWTQSYASDALSEYSQDKDGWTITTTGRPWASHVFYNMVFLPELNALFVHTSPYHNSKAKEISGITDFGEQSWLYFTGTDEWMPLKESKPPGVWATGLSYNPKLNRVVAQSKSGTTYLFNPELDSLTWESVPSSGGHPSSIETGAGFNPVSKRSFRFAGNYSLNNQLTEYDPVNHHWEALQTTGNVPESIVKGGPAMAVDNINNVLTYHAVISPSDGTAETWVLDLTSNIWEKMNPTSVPPNYGFNFMTTFYEKGNVILYYTKSGLPQWSASSELWAYRYKSSEIPQTIITPAVLLLL